MSGPPLHDLSRWAPEDAIYEKFFAAIEYGTTEDVKLCLEMHEINVNLLKGKFPSGINALHIAAGNGNVDIIELLLANGANVDELVPNTDGGGTALHQAAYSAQILVIRLLVDSGAKMDVYDACECLPLHAVLWYADVVESKHREVIKFLVERGSELSALQKSTGETVYIQVAKLGDVELLQYLLAAGYSVNDDTAWGVTSALAEAVGNNRTKAVRFLIDSGATVDEDVVIRANTIEIFDILRSHVDQELLETCGVLQTATMGKRRELVLHMLSIGMDVNGRHHGHTALMSLVMQRDPSEMIKFMMSKGADVSLQSTRTGDTALHRACHLSIINVVDILLKAASDVHAVNLANRTPLASFARNMGAHYHYYQERRRESEHPRLETLRMLIEAGSDVNAQDNIGRTPLHDVIFDHAPRYLFKVPLMTAAANMLIKAGARMDLPDNEGKTVRDLIVAHEHRGMRILLSETWLATCF